MSVTETHEAYEFIHDLDLPPLGAWFTVGGNICWDRDGHHPVDMEELVRAGYCRPVRITTTREYL